MARHRQAETWRARFRRRRALHRNGRALFKERITFGKPLSERQGITFKLADSYVELHAARLMVYQAAWKNDQKQDIRNEAYMAKLFADEMSFRVVDRVLQIHGGIGLTLICHWRNGSSISAASMITEGASEVMRMVHRTRSAEEIQLEQSIETFNRSVVHIGPDRFGCFELL